MTLAFAIAMNALILLDWGQTRRIATEKINLPETTVVREDGSSTTTNAYTGYRYREINPILGEHPSIGKVNRYFLAYAAVANGVFFALPEPHRFWFGGAVIGIQAYFVARNASIGIEVKF